MCDYLHTLYSALFLYPRARAVGPIPVCIYRKGVHKDTQPIKQIIILAIEQDTNAFGTTPTSFYLSIYFYDKQTHFDAFGSLILLTRT